MRVSPRAVDSISPSVCCAPARSSTRVHPAATNLPSLQAQHFASKDELVKDTLSGPFVTDTDQSNFGQGSTEAAFTLATHFLIITKVAGDELVRETLLVKGAGTGVADITERARLTARTVEQVQSKVCHHCSGVYS